MKLNKLTVTDFGPYRDSNDFDLRTTPDSPIILFGGKNGAGKTTLFQSVQLCLHGQSALGRKTSESEYKSTIRDKLHDKPEGKSKTASIQLQFEYANLGERDTYLVERSWRDRGKSIVETLTVKKNGEELSNLDDDQWQDFLKELIPPGISQLFFFDGEKVQELATSIENNSTFGDSITSLLGLDLVERLETDLSIYISNKLEESGKDELIEELNEIEDELDDLDDQIEELEVNIATKKDQLSELNREVSHLEEELAQEGGVYAEKREELKEERAHLRSNRESLEEDLREIIMGGFPFALAPDLCSNVEKRLREEASTLHETSARKGVINELDDVVQNDEIKSEIDGDSQVVEDVVTQIQSHLSEQTTTSEKDIELADSFSERQRERMYQIVNHALTQVPNQVDDLCEEIQELDERIVSVEQQLSRAPDEAAISPLVEKINQKREKRGQLKEQLSELDSKHSELLKRQSYLDSEKDRIIDKEGKLDDISDRAELAKRTRKAVKSYQDQLVEQKFDRLEEVLTQRYRQLSNKGDYYQRVHINQNEVNMQIETADGNKKDQAQLSAGERQIFATALIWALAEISDRPLPFIIDTPLGRLDHEHRENLVKNFIPEASHQVLVLSTDTEITDEYYEYLSSWTAGEYHLQYDEDEGCTNYSRGYFADENQDADSSSRSTEQAPIEGYTNE
jgi:DNA sulfur modification protein DndD